MQGFAAACVGLYMHALETCPSASSSLPRILDVTADIVADVLAVDTPRLQLRALQRDDAAAVELLRTCDDAPTWLHVPFAVMAAATEEGSRLAFVMRSHATGEVVGMVAITRAANQCAIDCYVAPTHVRRGYAREAVTALARVALAGT